MNLPQRSMRRPRTLDYNEILIFTATDKTYLFFRLDITRNM